MRQHRTRGLAKGLSSLRPGPLPRQLNVAEAKAVFSRLIDEAASGGRFVIAKAGRPIAMIVPLEKRSEKFVFGTMKGLLDPKDEQALLDAIEAPLPDDAFAMSETGALTPPKGKVVR